MDKKIQKIVTITQQDWARFNLECQQMIDSKLVPYDKVQITYTPINEKLGTGGLREYTQQFVKYED